ncbi:hypothetical protein PUG42_05815 [Erwiniaceae bacterium L1_54_3]|nr:hypothetical protein [Erwiniaceae bacterium L1_54_3]
MTNQQSNKELVKAGHAFAAAMSMDTPIIVIAKMVTELANRLDVSNARANVMAAEVLRINSVLPAAITALQKTDADIGLIDEINVALSTPACDQWIRVMRSEALGEAKRMIGVLANHQQPGIAHAINIISQMEMDLLRSRPNLQVVP